MQIRTCIGVIALATFGTLAHGAHANDRDISDWQSVDTTISLSGSTVKKNKAGEPLNLELITTSNEDATGKVGFVCLNGRFKAAVATKPVDLEATLKQIWQRDHVIRRTKPRLTINGKTKANAVWARSNKLGVVLPSSKKVSVQLYNAVIRQDEVYLEMSGMKKTRLILPTSDNAFANFGAECGLGLKAEEQ